MAYPLLFGKKHYNRGLFSASGFCQTVKRQMTEKPGAMYHTAFDVFGNMDIDSDISLVTSEDAEKCYLEKIGVWGKRFITLNTGLNREYLRKNNTRAWEFEKWKALSKRIKEKYPDILIVQVGIRMRDADDIPADIHMNGKTTLEEIGFLLKHAFIHVDYDSGLVHLRHTWRKKSIVLMGPLATDNHWYGENTYVQTSVCTPCEWHTPQWLSVCEKGEQTPPCMRTITVDMVMDEIDKEV